MPWLRDLLTPGLILLTSLAAAAPAPATGQGWSGYVNERYQYSLCYPRNVFTPQREADNGDGRTFGGPQGTSLLVFGTMMLSEPTLGAEAESKARALREGGAKLTYAVIKPAFFVLSGTQGTSIFYIKTIRLGDAYATLEMRYPRSVARSWDATVTRMSRCFRSAIVAKNG